MENTSYNGKSQPLRRLYDTLKKFTIENEVHKAGDILCVASRNDDNYDVFLSADGKRTFKELWAAHQAGGVDTLDEVIRFLSGFSGDLTLREVLNSLIEVTESEGTLRVKVNEV